MFQKKGKIPSVKPSLKTKLTDKLKTDYFIFPKSIFIPAKNLLPGDMKFIF